MSDQPDQPEQSPISVTADQSLLGGVYANAAMAWHTQHEFTLDFFVEPGPQSTEERRLHMVARVRIPTSVIFEIARVIATSVHQYEQKFGEIPNRGRPLQTPPDEWLDGEEDRGSGQPEGEDP